MQLELEGSLAFITVTLAYQGAHLIVTKVLVDTGSEHTVLAGDVVAAINIAPQPTDLVHTISGVGGIETVFGRQVDYVQVGDRKLTDFPIQVGGMDYGFEINGILGMDFLTRAGALINLRELQIEFVG
jgi:predicted aspartyl protease